MVAIPWQTGAAAPAAPASAAPTFPSGPSWSQGSPGWDAYLTGLQQQYANANAQYPTGNLPTGTTASGGGYQLSPAQLQQWQNYFSQGAGGTTAGTAGGTPGYEPSDSIKADQITFRGTPLPYLKFPRHPTLH